MSGGTCLLAAAAATQRDPIRERLQRKRGLRERLFSVPKLLRSMWNSKSASQTASEIADSVEGDDAARTQQQSTSHAEDARLAQSLPDEMLVEVFRNLDRPAMLNARRTCARWNAVVLRNMRGSLPVLTVSRLTITYVKEAGAYKLVWCKYPAGENSCHELFVPVDDLTKPNTSLGFCFSQLDIQRLIIESMPKGMFNDEFVRFLCTQFRNCRDFQPVQLSVKDVDLSKLSPEGLKQLLIQCSKKLEILEFFGIGNVASDLITDEHLRLLEHNRVRRLSIQFNETSEAAAARPSSLQVGDASLQTFARARIFPTLAIGHCSVSAAAVCDFAKEWLTMVGEEDFIKSQSLRLSDCPNVSSESLEEECRRLGLIVIKRVEEPATKHQSDDTPAASSGTLINYTIQMNKPQQGFIVNLFTSHHHNQRVIANVENNSS